MTVSTAFGELLVGESGRSVVSLPLLTGLDESAGTASVPGVLDLHEPGHVLMGDATDCTPSLQRLQSGSACEAGGGEGEPGCSSLMLPELDIICSWPAVWTCCWPYGCTSFFQNGKAHARSVRRLRVGVKRLPIAVSGAKLLTRRLKEEVGWCGTDEPATVDSLSLWWWPSVV